MLWWGSLSELKGSTGSASFWKIKVAGGSLVMMWKMEDGGEALVVVWMDRKRLFSSQVREETGQG